VGEPLAQLTLHRLSRAVRRIVVIMGSAETWQDLFRVRRSFRNIDVHLYAALEWMLRAIEITQGRGVAAHYTLGIGWGSGYPETTGYIIPTLLSLAQKFNRQDLGKAALHQADWLLTQQLSSGGFPGGETRLKLEETIFNTGQIVRGLTEAWRHSRRHSHDQKYLESAILGAKWMCSVQDKDGAWRRFTSPLTTTQEHSYDVLSAWGLWFVGKNCGKQEFCNSAIRQYEWTLKQQNPLGFFEKANFEKGVPPLTHSLAYVVEGVFEIAKDIKDQKGILALQNFFDQLTRRYPKAQALPGRIGADFSPEISWSCVTGNIQLGWMACRLGRLISDHTLEIWGKGLIEFAASHQRLETSNMNIRGGVFGSTPIYGGYFPFSVLNWGTKYLLDALMFLKTSE